MCFSEVSGNQDRWFDQRERRKKKKGGFSLKVETGSETEQIKRYQTKNRVQH